jgi:hypothetical protein
MIKLLNPSVAHLRLMKTKSVIHTSLIVGTLVALLSFPGKAGQPLSSSSSFVILLEGVYEPVVNAPNLGLSQVDLRDQSLIPLKIEIYDRDSGVPAPTEKAVGTFYVQLVGDLCTYHLPGGSFAAQFVGGGFDITDDGDGSWTGTGTWELNILEATGTYKPFAGGHIHMVDVLKFRSGDGTYLEHCFCHVSQ